MHGGRATARRQSIRARPPAESRSRCAVSTRHPLSSVDPSARRSPSEGPQEHFGADAAFESRSFSGEVVRQSFSLRSSPYPAPDELAEYEQIHPGFTDRMLGLAERETAHRIENEARQTSATIELAKRGQILAFVVVMTLVGGGIAGILTGHSIAGLAGMILAAATLAGAFVAPNVFARKIGTSEAGPPAIEPSADAGGTDLLAEPQEP